jgi:hypothetical protein
VSEKYETSAVEERSRSRREREIKGRDYRRRGMYIGMGCS